MLPKNRNVVSPKTFDRLFQLEAKIAQFSSPEEEAAYVDRDSNLINLIRRVAEVHLRKIEQDGLFVGDDWWPNHTRYLEITAGHCTSVFLGDLQNLLKGEYENYRIQICVYGDPEDGRTYIGSTVFYSNRVLIEENLELFLNEIDAKGLEAATMELARRPKCDGTIAVESDVYNNLFTKRWVGLIPPPWLVFYSLTFVAGSAFLTFFTSDSRSIYRVATSLFSIYCFTVGILLWIRSPFALNAYTATGFVVIGFAAYRMVTDGFSTPRMATAIGGLLILYCRSSVAEELQNST